MDEGPPEKSTEFVSRDTRKLSCSINKKESESRMKRNQFKKVFQVAVCGALLSLATRTLQAESTPLLISAAASLKDSMQEVVKTYEAVDPNVKIVTTFGSSGALGKQIEQGAPVDLFISASKGHMDSLEKAGLVLEGTRRDLFMNKLVLIAPLGAKAPTSFEAAATNGVGKIALGEPTSVPVGQYSFQVFTKLGVADAVKTKAVYAKDVKQVLTYVERGEVESGIVYYTDALVSKKVQVMADAAEDTHSPIVYPGAVISSTKQKEAAQALMTWLASDAGKAIFKKYGFVVK